MIELLLLGAVTAAGYFPSKKFVKDRLRFVDAAQNPAVPVVAGAVAAVVVSPLAALPVITLGTAALFGIGVGFGVRSGVRAIRRALPGE
ncbi:MAG TPA: hypothetical protein VKA84_18855 [Gemmatimonadaceae bacterium]|nr:hypothetical protein [Gemmatimonadaceae bacterium]